MSSKDTRRIK